MYIGHTSDLVRRISQHNNGKVKATKPFTPYKLVHYEVFVKREEAVLREKELKKSPGRRFLRSLIFE